MSSIVRTIELKRKKSDQSIENIGHVLLSQCGMGKDGYQGKAPIQCGRQRYMQTRTERWNCRKLLPVVSGGWRSWLHVRQGRQGK